METSEPPPHTLRSCTYGDRMWQAR